MWRIQLRGSRPTPRRRARRTYGYCLSVDLVGPSRPRSRADEKDRKTAAARVEDTSIVAQAVPASAVRAKGSPHGDVTGVIVTPVMAAARSAARCPPRLAS